MRAVVHDRYGPPEVLRVDDVERPVPAEDEVLVCVRASTVTRGDAMSVRSNEYRFARMFTGIRRPRRTGFGSEFAGVVEEVGAAVSDFRAGDEVFGFRGGATADYVTVPESGVIATKPAGLSFDEAAAVPDGSLLALTCLKPAYPLQGKSVLVYGAAGSVGTAAVQLLAHHFDAVGKHSFRRSRASLKSGGIYISMDLGFMYHVPLLALVTRFVGSRRTAVGIGRYRQEDLLLVKQLVEEGKYRPVIDRTYALEDIVEATRYVESGQKTGNVVLRVSEAPSGAAQLW